MVQAMIHLEENTDRVLNIIKGKFGLSNKSQAVNLIVQKFEEEFLEPELRPEYVKRLKKIEKGPFKKFKSSKDALEFIKNL